MAQVMPPFVWMIIWGISYTKNGTTEDAVNHPLTKVLTPEGYVDYATPGKAHSMSFSVITKLAILTSSNNLIEHS